MKNCDVIQEAIAVGSSLTHRQTLHINSCTECSLALREYRQLEELFLLSAEVEIPAGFADRVMNQIEAESAVAVEDWFTRLQASIAALMARPAPQWALLSFAAAVSASNFLRFVFYILTPAGN